MTVLLDTNILIDFFHNAPGAVSLMKTIGTSRLAVSVLTVMEMVHGAEKTKTPDRYIREFRNFLSDFSVAVWPVDDAIATRCGILLARMSRRGVHLGVVDGLLAATAFHHRCAIASHDAAFTRIPGIQMKVTVHNSDII